LDGAVMTRYVYVNVYETGRDYGGPEEGGWYYDVGTAYRVMPVRRDRAERLLDTVLAWCRERNRLDRRRSGGSVLATGDYLEAWIQDYPGRDYPERRPRYE